MMKIKLVLIFIMLTGFKIFSQDIEKIKKADTIYIYFKKNKVKLQQYIVDVLPNRSKTHRYIYSFSDKRIHLEFSHNIIFKPDVRKEKKSFLIKHKDIILDYDFIEKNGFCNLTEYINTKKRVFYLIDNKDINKFSMKLIQVTVHGCIELGEE